MSQNVTLDPAVAQYRLFAAVERAASLDAKGYKFEALREPNSYLVDTGHTMYLLKQTGMHRLECSCPDYQERGLCCKHSVGLALRLTDLDEQRRRALVAADPFLGDEEYMERMAAEYDALMRDAECATGCDKFAEY